MLDASPKEVLIIEDNMIIAADIAFHLKSFGYHVTGVHRKAEDAVKSLNNNLPDIIIIDISLAGKMSGIELASYIHQNCQIPFIFLSGGTDDVTYNQAIECQPHAFISKPFRSKRLYHCLQSVHTTPLCSLAN